MVDVTDTSYRQLARLLAPSVRLYTEMFVDHKILRHPSIFAGMPYQSHTTVQLGGSNIDTMMAAIDTVRASGLFDSVNVNMGCPAPSAHRGSHGAMLMKDRHFLSITMRALVDRCHALSLPLSVKLRIGVDDSTDYQFFHSVVRTLLDDAGVRHFIVHCRPAMLHMSTSKNLVVPPLNYDHLLRVIGDVNDSGSGSDSNRARFEVNGGIDSVDKLLHWLHQDDVDGVMIGRWTMRSIWDLTTIEALLTNTATTITCDNAIEAYCRQYLASLPPNITTLSAIRPLFSLFHGERGCKSWRMALQSGIHSGSMTPLQIVEHARRTMREITAVGTISASDNEDRARASVRMNG